MLQKAEIRWAGWHAFRRGLATLLNSLDIDDSVIQQILRHSDVSVTQAFYIKPFNEETDRAARQVGDFFPTCTPTVLQNADAETVQ